ncbi:MAG: 50S ribosomal protein L23, partial [Lachnospiraceae bacterium]
KGYDGIADKRYTFYVKNTANKIEIRSAVEKLFGVKVAKVNTINCKGKLKRMGRNEGYTPDRKKAVVILKEDSKPIEFFNSLA